MASVFPWVAMTRRAPVSRTVRIRSGQSAWSDTTNPRSWFRRRRLPRTRIQPEAKPVCALRNRLIHGLPAAEGGASTSSPANPSPVSASRSGTVGSMSMPACRYTSTPAAIAPCNSAGRSVCRASSANSRCALPSA